MSNLHIRAVRLNPAVARLLPKHTQHAMGHDETSDHVAPAEEDRQEREDGVHGDLLKKYKNVKISSKNIFESVET